MLTNLKFIVTNMILLLFMTKIEVFYFQIHFLVGKIKLDASQ